MRVGQNPAKNLKTVARPARITVAVLNYIPYLSGFYNETLEVLKICLETARAGADLPFDLLVFDNGSCSDVQDYLLEEQRQEHIQFLFLSQKNLGKGGAWNIILDGAPGEIIAYSDSDALFYPGWLSHSVEILETYPRVGMVTARALRTPEDLYSSTLAWAEKNQEVEIESGQLMSWDLFKEFAATMGYGEEKDREIYQSTRDVRLSYKSVTAYAGANHFQFIGWKSTLREFTPFKMDRPMGQVRMLDQRLNEAGYLRLMTADPLVQNMSNRVPPEYISRVVQRRGKATSFSKSVFNFEPIKKVLLWAHDAIFRMYYE